MQLTALVYRHAYANLSTSIIIINDEDICHPRCTSSRHGGVHLRRPLANKVHSPTMSDAYDKAITTVSRGVEVHCVVISTVTMKTMGADGGEGDGSSKIRVI